MRTVNFDGVAIGELSADFLSTPVKIHVKAAFINTKTGQTHGWTSCSQWSAETIEKLKELRLLMVRDIETHHFADAASDTPSVTSPTGLKSEFKGLGEKLRSTVDEVPQG